MATGKTMKKIDLSEVYPNSPLVEVVCEIRFPGELSIECRKDEFYAKIRDKYPNILVPQVKPGQALALDPYRFENDKKPAGIMLALNRFSFYDKEYNGHEKFIKEFLRLAKILCQTYSLNKLNRLGWRYINIIPFTREEGIVPLRHFLSIEIKVPQSVSDQFENLSIVIISKVPDGSITTRIESMIRLDNEQEVLLLDFDFAMTQDLHFSKISNYIKNAHEQTRLLFENLITDKYRQYLRGEEI